MTRYVTANSTIRTTPGIGTNFAISSSTIAMQIRISIFFCFFVMGKRTLSFLFETTAAAPEALLPCLRLQLDLAVRLDFLAGL